MRRILAEAGWTTDEPWTQLRRELADPVPPVPLRFDVVTPDRVEDRIGVEAAAFPGSSLTLKRWAAMADGYAYRQARCLVGYTETGDAAEATTVWSAGRGRPGLIEPLGVDSAHRGHGFGVAMAQAAASTLRAMGASSVTVATPSSNTAAVATYRAAGMDSLGEVTDFRRP
ncbi:GNAT family N-acetyltransferase [Brevibacterium atlanticum]|uniref:GNAT family N-acetyltransferase n=1 Tax=Brevibacterium atlanticum TaxID=2697563 RepID=UPI001AA0CF54|nr:GNAT family N-acetyltransferase [Brevibacterium atlanticum]